MARVLVEKYENFIPGKIKDGNEEYVQRIERKITREKVLIFLIKIKIKINIFT